MKRSKIVKQLRKQQRIDKRNQVDANDRGHYDDVEFLEGKWNGIELAIAYIQTKER